MEKLKAERVKVIDSLVGSTTSFWPKYLTWNLTTASPVTMTMARENTLSACIKQDHRHISFCCYVVLTLPEAEGGEWCKGRELTTAVAALVVWTHFWTSAILEEEREGRGEEAFFPPPPPLLRPSRPKLLWGDLDSRELGSEFTRGVVFFKKLL